METTPKKIKSLSWKRRTDASINPCAPHRYWFASRGDIYFRVYSYTAGLATPSETVVHIRNYKDQPADQRVIVADERAGHEFCNTYLRNFLTAQAAASVPKENVERVLAEMITAMEPTIAEAIKRERTRELSYAKAFLAAKKKEVTLTLNQWARDAMGIARDKVLGYNTNQEYKQRQQVSATESQAHRYLRCVDTVQYTGQSKYVGAWELSNIDIDKLDKNLNTSYRAMLIGRLRNAWLSYVPTNVSKMVYLEVAPSPKGFVADAVLEMEDGKRQLFNTKCIGAGGYNIKCFHYRYITHVKEVAEKKSVPAEKPARKVAAGKKPLEIKKSYNKKGQLIVHIPEFDVTFEQKNTETEKGAITRARRWAYTTRRVHVHGWNSKKKLR